MNENNTTIGDRIISVGYLPALKAVKVQVAIANLCGEALFKAVTTKNNNPEEAGAAAISALTSHLDSDVLINAMTTVFEYVTIDGKRVSSIDEAFAGGRNKELWQVFFFALKVNFKDFFPESLFRSIAAKVTPSQSNSSTSTGTSGDR
ncbi:phage tail assemb.y chaperone protein [Caudoviricetes sp.]|nr:phage tail assemb.y chaperone protein [Caudoviricetes sp.]